MVRSYHVPLLWHVKKLSVPCKTSTGKLFDSLPKNDAVAELSSGKFNVANCRDPVLKLRTTPP
jgi:hypothetical protein